MSLQYWVGGLDMEKNGWWEGEEREEESANAKPLTNK